MKAPFASKEPLTDEINLVAQLDAEKQELKKAISNIQLVLSFIPRGKNKVPEAKISEVADPDILLLCDLSKKKLLEERELKNKMLADIQKMLADINERITIFERKTSATMTPTGENSLNLQPL